MNYNFEVLMNAVVLYTSVSFIAGFLAGVATFIYNRSK